MRRRIPGRGARRGALGGVGLAAWDELVGRGDPESVVVMAVGDIAPTVDPLGREPPRSLARTLAPLRPLFARADLVLGNLECTLPAGGREVDTEPRLLSSGGLLGELGAAGVHAVSLANNHALDSLAPGLAAVRAELAAAGVGCFGAGADLAEAVRPLRLEVRGRRLAFLGAADTRSTPADRFATAERPGVAPLDLGRLALQIRELRGSVDHVVVVLHWGVECLRVPAPDQVAAARALARAGAALVVGNHPHVMQGMEVHAGAPIAYSLGNFAFNDFYCPGGRIARCAERPLAQRVACALAVRLSRGRATEVVRLPTCDSGEEVVLDPTGYGERRLRRADAALARGVGVLGYRLEHARVRVLLPVLRNLRWSKLRTLRLRRLREVVVGLRAAARAG